MNSVEPILIRGCQLSEHCEFVCTQESSDVIVYDNPGPRTCRSTHNSSRATDIQGYAEDGNLDADDVITRAYALGAASDYGTPDNEAVGKDLKERAPDSRDASPVELASEERRSKVLELEWDLGDPTELRETFIEPRLCDADEDSEPGPGVTGPPHAFQRRATRGSSSREPRLTIVPPEVAETKPSR